MSSRKTDLIIRIQMQRLHNANGNMTVDEIRESTNNYNRKTVKELLNILKSESAKEAKITKQQFIRTETQNELKRMIDRLTTAQDKRKQDGLEVETKKQNSLKLSKTSIKTGNMSRKATIE